MGLLLDGVNKMGKYEQALGIISFEVGGIAHELAATFKHKRKFRKIIMDEKLSKDRAALFDQFSNFAVDILKEFDQEQTSDEETREYVETYLMDLFKNFMVEFKYSTWEKLEASEREQQEEVKKLLANR